MSNQSESESKSSEEGKSVPKVEKRRGRRKDEHKLWVMGEWYVPVDDKGQCIGKCAEGALGFVVKLHSAYDEQHQMALKLPRLLGDTHRENAYINDLTENELKAVRKIFQGGDAPAGLLNAQVVQGSPLRGPISTYDSIPEALKWDGAHVFVHFKKGHNPYFCLVKPRARGGLEKLPETTSFPIDSADVLRVIEEAAKDSVTQRKWSESVFIESTNAREANENGAKPPLNILNVTQALQTNVDGDVWYIGVPSIIYGWAEGTLQESISRGGTKDWSINDHLRLIGKIGQGIVTLHRKYMLHADVRPANVVFQGDPNDPENYFLSDYGSLAETGTGAATRNANIGGFTTLGPVVGGERTSAFYAPERRNSQERETSDTAVIHYTGDGDRLYVVLGWRSELVDENDLPRQDIVSNIISQAQEKQSQIQNQPQAKGNKSTLDISTGYLQRGDRIQIRDLIFELLHQGQEVEDKRVLTCRKDYWKVYHGRIVVAAIDDEQFQGTVWFPIPRTIELLQWSAATDLFSLGAMALYSVFRAFLHRLKEKHDVLEDGGQKQVMGKIYNKWETFPKNNSDIEDTFHLMLDALSSPPYLKVIWQELDWLRKQIEDRLRLDELSEDKLRVMELDIEQRKDFTARKLADTPFIRHDGRKPEPKSLGHPYTIKDEVLYVVKRITQTIPGVEYLLAAFHYDYSEYDLGSFIFFIHFVLSCLHRQTHIQERLNDEDSTIEMVPFCEDRKARPAPNGAATIAFIRLDFMRNHLIGNTLLSELRVLPNLIPKYDPRPDAEIRAEIEVLRDEGHDLKGKVQELDRDKEGLETSLKSIQNSLIDLRSGRTLGGQRFISNDKLQEILDVIEGAFNHSKNVPDE